MKDVITLDGVVIKTFAWCNSKMVMNVYVRRVEK